MSVLQWRGWDRLDSVDRKAGVRPHDPTPAEIARAAKWWPWTLVLQAVSTAAAVVLVLLDHSLSTLFVNLAIVNLFHVLAAWAASHPRRP